MCCLTTCILQVWKLQRHDCKNPDMKKIILIGTVSCGKTTLCQFLNGCRQEYKKTQTLEVINQTIDTPGEYLEHRAFMRNLMVLSADVDYVLFLIDPTQARFMYSPGHAASFPVPVIGVITKTDIATEEEISDAEEMLELAGVSKIFSISAFTGAGTEQLIEFLT